MKNALETYQLELKGRGPVYIGSGREIQKKEYVFLDKTTVGVVDIEKLRQNGSYQFNIPSAMR